MTLLIKFGNFNYRNCEDIEEAVKPLLVKYNCALYLSDEIILLGERHYVKAIATFTDSIGYQIKVSGWAREEENKKGMDSAQLSGSTSSYARKYALDGLFLIDDTKDADGLPPEKSKPQFNSALDRAAKEYRADKNLDELEVELKTFQTKTSLSRKAMEIVAKYKAKGMDEKIIKEAIAAQHNKLKSAKVSNTNKKE